ncbi:hypothetical protein [Aliarcobacter butzleri]|uniref:hypothetical protein n=1 Tax=Aliarcobacter butzleri TaxID=28197 RepID=UPI00126A2392|nr:hypothetical protein [Aliarcobacter butzleri]
MNSNKRPITIVKNKDIFGYLHKLNSHGIKPYVLDFDNFSDFIIEVKYGFKKKDINFDCLVTSRDTYTDSTIEDDFILVSNEDFITQFND